MKPIYIAAAEQISIQQPLSQVWMQEPILYQQELVKAVNPAFRDYLAANEVRRMGNIMKRALVTALKVLKKTDTPHPDAIITGTSIGCLDYTEKFLDAMVENGEEALSPTFFMQSTHNTVGSTLGIYTKSHGYNVTYSHGGVSFELALLDAWMQMQLGRISTALVGGHDEMTQPYFELLKKTGYVGQPGMVPCSEVAMSMLLSNDAARDHLCELAGIRVFHGSTIEAVTQETVKLLDAADMTVDNISAVMTGVNGNAINDTPYQEVTAALFPGKPQLYYKHLFGENYTVSALGVYAAAYCLKHSVIPSTLLPSTFNAQTSTLPPPQSILLLNQTENRDFALVLLRKS